MRQKQILSYVKPTNYCNVDCDHCYLPLDVRQDRHAMNSDMLKTTATFLLNVVSQTRAKSLIWLWHGGEPFMLKPKFYRDAGKIIDEVFIDKTMLIEAVQTSLIPYTSAMGELAHERWDSYIGTSIDFEMRHLKGNKDYLETFMTKVDLARSDGIYVLPGMVPSKSEIGKMASIVKWFDENGFDAFNIDRYNNYTGNQIPLTSFAGRPTNEEHSNMLIELFDDLIYRFENKKKTLKINVLEAGIRGVLKHQPGDRWGGNCQSDFVVINPDGTTSNCPDKASYENFGNISEGSSSFLNNKLRTKSITNHSLNHMNQYCSSCSFNDWCQTGCPITSNNIEKEGDCAGYSKFLNHIKNSAKDEKILGYLEDYINLNFLKVIVS